ncbi:hypothetical protein [Actinosynnema sp. NPDC020468]|uniref:hypothetical protein n=1 Tax=Actinosynnema sp. NPDC020468 TaxID=3154488 RepID=UPI0033E2E24A
MRADLLALTTDALVALANRGLVKRAAKEADGLELSVVGDTITGRFPDGVEAVLPGGVALESAPCSCGAAGVCRHRIAVVLAYQAQGEAAEFRPWDPGGVDDAELTARFGERAVAAARRAVRAGVAVRLIRPTERDPVAVAELPSCTVRFLVPGDLSYVDTDAAAARRAEVVVLAVWAFREAEGRDGFDLGGVPRVDASGPAAVRELTGRLLRDGAVHTSPVLDAEVRRLHQELVAARLHWPAAALEELADQLDAYRSRGAAHRVERVAELITELHARCVATGQRTRVLGSDEVAETPLRRVRLTALGCRVRAVDDERVAEVCFAGGGSVLVLRHRWSVGADEVVTGHDLVTRRVGGAALGALAVSNVVSESAVRSPSRLVRIASSRVSKTSITPLGDAWDDLPDALVVRDFAATARALRDLPPRVVRARVEAESVRVVRIARVRSVGYDPGAQRLDAVVVDEQGVEATVSAVHRSVAPAALDVLAEALESGPRYVSGAVRRAGGRLSVEPLAVRTADALVVPDLAEGGGTTALGTSDRPAIDPVEAALRGAVSACAEVAHRGVDHLPPTMPARLAESVADLRRVGLVKAADRLAAFAEHPTADHWHAAHLRLLVTAEAR